jgi:hypothetical protein
MRSRRAYSCATAETPRIAITHVINQKPKNVGSLARLRPQVHKLSLSHFFLLLQWDRRLHVLVRSHGLAEH